MNKEKIKTITIIAMSIIIILLLICIIFMSNNKYYKKYDDALIKINNNSSFEVSSNVLHDQILGVLLTSKNKNPKIGDVKVTFYNKKGKKISSDSFSKTVYDNGATMFTFNTPMLSEDDYAGRVMIEVDDKNIENYNTQISIHNIDQKIEKKIQKDNSLLVKATLDNKNNVDLSVLAGDIVAIKNGKIVATTAFYEENVKAHDNTIVEATFYPYISNQKFEYDEIKVYINAIANITS